RTECSRSTASKSSTNEKVDRLNRWTISNNGSRFQKMNCEHWRNSARSIVLPNIAARQCGKWKKRCTTICLHTTGVILSEAKDLSHEALVTLGTKNIPSPFVRSLVPLGMTRL